MKNPSVFAAIVTILLPLCSGADEVRISTTVFQAPDSLNLPGQVRVISKSEWQQTLRTLAQKKGTYLWVAPAARTSSGKTARVNLPEKKPASFWRRDEEPVFPVSSFAYTPEETRGDVELRGVFQLNPGAVRDKDRGESFRSVEVHGLIPEDKVLTFGLGGYFFMVEASPVE